MAQSSSICSRPGGTDSLTDSSLSACSFADCAGRVSRKYSDKRHHHFPPTETRRHGLVLVCFAHLALAPYPLVLLVLAESLASIVINVIMYSDKRHHHFPPARTIERVAQKLRSLRFHPPSFASHRARLIQTIVLSKTLRPSLRSLRCHPPRLRRIAVFLIQTIVLSLVLLSNVIRLQYTPLKRG